VNYFGYEDDVRLEPSREWMDRNRAHPFLLSYLTLTAHHDYRLPGGIEQQDFIDDPKLKTITSTARATRTGSSAGSSTR
jgi:lipoteichoic acid synthase